MIFKFPYKAVMISVFVILLIVFSITSLMLGSYQLAIGEVFTILKVKIFGGDEGTLEKLKEVIVWKVRSPRIILAIICGIAFSLSGTVYQACFRNPLVEPYILGVAAGASFGAAMGILFPQIIPSVQISAFFCALFAVFLSYAISLTKGRTPVVTLVISGVVIGSVFSALVSLLKYLAPDAQLREITFWMMGGFYYATWKDVMSSAPVVGLVFILVFALAWKLNILSMGDEEARTLGVNPDTYRILFILVSTLVSSLCVSQVGIVSWVGLMAPHVARMLFGADNTYVIPAGALFGAIFLLLCDTLARTISGSEIPIGIVTSIVGAPFLVYLLRSKGSEIYS